MESNNKILFAKDLQIDTSNIPAELGYILIYPYPEEKKYMKEYIDLKPSISTFRDENQNLKEILDEYKESYHDLKGRKNLCF